MLIRSRLPVALAVVSLGFLGIPGVAAASKVIAPPGNSGVSQYVEVVPGAGGSVPVGASGSHGPVLSAAQRRRLEAAGSSGRALAAFAQQTGVAHSKQAAPRAGAHRGAQPHNSSLSNGALAAAPVRSTAGAGGGLGWGLYAVLGAILLAGLGLLFVRHRTA